MKSKCPNCGWPINVGAILGKSRSTAKRAAAKRNAAKRWMIRDAAKTGIHLRTDQED